MISSAKRLCNKYLSFSNDGGVFHLRLYPQGELLTAVAQWCQVLFGSLDIDYLSCSKLPLRVQKKCVWWFFFFFPWLSECFWAILYGVGLHRPRIRPLDTRGNFRLCWEDTYIWSHSVVFVLKSFTRFCSYIAPVLWLHLGNSFVWGLPVLFKSRE